MSSVTLVLASASPARLQTLRNAGIDPTVFVSEVDEDAVMEPDPARLATTLAQLKCRDVVARLSGGLTGGGSRTLIVGCDSVLDVDGTAYGKPLTPDVAMERLRALSGRSAVLHTGHAVADLATGQEQVSTASTTVTFATLTDAEISAYVATGEPLRVAGSFTLDGLGGAFVERIDGDPHNVVGLSLPLLRRMLAALDVHWPDLWGRGSGRSQQ